MKRAIENQTPLSPTKRPKVGKRDFENIKFLLHFKWIYTTDNINIEPILNPILTKTEDEEGAFLTYTNKDGIQSQKFIMSDFSTKSEEGKSEVIFLLQEKTFGSFMFVVVPKEISDDFRLFLIGDRKSMEKKEESPTKEVQVEKYFKDIEELQHSYWESSKQKMENVSIQKPILTKTEEKEGICLTYQDQSGKRSPKFIMKDYSKDQLDKGVLFILHLIGSYMTVLIDEKYVQDFEKFLTRGQPEEATSSNNNEEKDLKAAKKAFQVAELHNENLEPKPYLKEVLSDYLDQLQNASNYYFAPYTAIVQSSGTGKTRMLEILSRDPEFCVVYCNLNKYGNKAYPGRTKMFADYLLEPSLSKSDLEIRVFCYFQFFLQKIANETTSSAFFFTNSKDQKCEELFEDYKKSCIDFQPDPKNEHEIIRPNNQKKVVFAFDEARSLTELATKDNEDHKSYFSIYRRVIRKLFDKNAIVVFTDTMANLQFFMPRREADPSLRASKEGQRLLPPIYALPTWDLCVTDKKLDRIKNISQLVDIYHMASFGRPLWFMNLINTEETKKSKIIELAIDKLMCGETVEGLMQGNNRQTQFLLAVLGCRAVINLHPTSKDAVDLVANFMAINLYVPEDRSRMFITYSSEPILAEAAAKIWNKKYNEKSIFLHAIENLTSNICKGYINLGNLGEIVARIILLRAMDKAEKIPTSRIDNAIQYSKVVNVGQFLKSLIGQSEFNKFSKSYQHKKNLNKLLNAQMCFNHFIQSYANKSEDHGDLHTNELLNYAKRLGAMICRPGYPKTDLEIPIFFLDSKENKKPFDAKEGVADAKLDKENMGFIEIQVKRNNGGDNISSDWEDCTPLNLKYEDRIDSDKPFLVLYMQLGPAEITERTEPKIKYESTVQVEKEKRQEKQQETNSQQEQQTNQKKEAKTIDKETNEYLSRNRFLLFCRGISSIIYPFLSKPEADALRELAFAELQLEKIFSDKSQISDNSEIDLKKKKFESYTKYNHQQKENLQLEMLEQSSKKT